MMEKWMDRLDLPEEPDAVGELQTPERLIKPVAFVEQGIKGLADGFHISHFHKRRGNMGPVGVAVGILPLNGIIVDPITGRPELFHQGSVADLL